jgi:2-dehydropantoate 2-reductase
MKHAVLGAGAIGGLIGTVLASLGEDVTFAVKPEALSSYPASLALERPSGALAGPAKAVAELSDPADVLWISTKTYQLEAALAAVKSQPRIVVPLLNGIDHVAALRERFGHDRVTPGTIAVEAEKVAPGKFVQRSTVVRLNLALAAEPILGAVIRRMDALGFVSQFIPNEQTLLWSKLCFLGPFALVSSVSGMNIGEVLADPVWEEKLTAAIGEACAVANASGAEVDPQKTRKFFDGAPPAMRTSMQKDLAAGRQLELDAIGGPVLRGGKKYGIDVPTTASLITAIRGKSTGH